MIDDQKKYSFCYGCAAILKSPSLLVCAECLDQECDEYIVLANESDELATESFDETENNKVEIE